MNSFEQHCVALHYTVLCLLLFYLLPSRWFGLWKSGERFLKSCCEFFRTRHGGLRSCRGVLKAVTGALKAVTWVLKACHRGFENLSMGSEKSLRVSQIYSGLTPSNLDCNRTLFQSILAYCTLFSPNPFHPIPSTSTPTHTHTHQHQHSRTQTITKTAFECAPPPTPPTSTRAD
jgi:hypothetical protein